MKTIISLLIWIMGGLLTALLYFTILLIVIITFPFDKKRKLSHAQCYWWADSIISLNSNWDLHVSGLENIDKNKTYVIVANHLSLADIIIMYKIRAQFKWVAKESLFKIPFLGWCLSLCKHIKIERGKFSSIKIVYRKAAEWLRRDMSVLFFPEGTRSLTGEIQEFQNGAFKLAIKERVPVLPIRLEGTDNVIPKGSWVLKTKVPCYLKVFPAIDTTQFEAKDFEKLKNIVKEKLG